jgi:hypothetical protein
MYQIDNSTAVAVIPASTAAGSVGFFTDGNPVSNIPATILPAEFMNMLMMEMLGVLSAAGIAPLKATFNQLTAAIRKLNQQLVILTDTGVAGAYTAVNAPALTALPTTGYAQWINIAHPNPGAATYAPDGLAAKPIYGLGLQALQGGELPVGIALLRYLVQAGVNGGNGAWIIMESMGGPFQVTPGSAASHMATVGQLQSATPSFAVDTGVANAYVCAFTPALTVRNESAPLRFKVKTTNTLACTLNDGIGVVPLVGGAHTPLQGGEMLATGDAWVQWNPSVGAGSYVLLFCTGAAEQVAPATKSQHAMQLGQAVGRLLNIQVLTASGTYVPTPGMNNARVRGGGGSGGSGGAAATSSTQTAAGGGTAAGSYFDAWLSAATIGASQSVTIGAAGAAGAAGGVGGAGGSTSFGALLAAGGSPGGPAGTAVLTTASGLNSAGQPGAIASGGNILNATGSPATPGIMSGGTIAGTGGSSPFGAGGPVSSPGTGYSAGSGGSVNGISSAAKVGVVGVQGVIIVEEYA